MSGQKELSLGIDIGSTSVKAVLWDGRRIIAAVYRRIRGSSLGTLAEILADPGAPFQAAGVTAIGVTGTGGEPAARALGAPLVNEIIALARSASLLNPEVRTIIDIGGEDSKMISLEWNDDLGEFTIADFSTNTICAAGTGSFLDQQAVRLGVSIEKEFGELALKSGSPPRIAGRCSVFAKTDMIHLQQEGTPDYDIVAGLCFALARTFRNNIGRGKDFRTPVSFQGGVAANLGMVKAFREILGLDEKEFLVPPHHAELAAVGAAICAAPARLEIDRIRRRAAGPTGGKNLLGRLEKPSGSRTGEAAPGKEVAGVEGMNGKREGFLGIDVGSISTNVVVVTAEGEMLARRYLPTAGRPIEAVRDGIAQIGAEIGTEVKIAGVGTTGSGRYLIGEFVGADAVRNEITAQATAAAFIDPEVDTIFEIGGQDSKYISLENGTVVDFEMNKVCAAGTGSFLEEQAERLGISIREEFGRLALEGAAPASLGERCTVFMESEMVHQQQKATSTEDLVAGLAYSIVLNYLNRVVGKRKIGDRIFFQGAVALNAGVVAAFEKTIGKPVTVPPHNDVTGAIGVALIAARERDGSRPSRFRGWREIVEMEYRLNSFECTECPNHCEIREVRAGGGEPFYYGSRCEKYNVADKKEAGRAPSEDLFALREKLLLARYGPEPGREVPSRGRVGLPRALLFHEFFPLWKAFFEELGLEIVLSDRTSKKIIRRGIDLSAAETCFPIKVAFGHLASLVDREIDYLFLPMVVNMPRNDPGQAQSYNCPYVQAFPFMARATMEFPTGGPRILTPKIALGWSEKTAARELGAMARTMGIGEREAARAFRSALRAQELFRREMLETGRRVLAEIPPGVTPVVIVSRPYNGCDPAVNLNLPRKLSDLGALPVPLDFLPLESVDTSRRWPGIYWRYGQKIMAAASLIRQDDRLQCLYLTNFGCGPDSFIGHFFKEEMKGKPYLEIEIDEHSADVGAITRCEAFLDSVRAAASSRRSPAPAREPAARRFSGLERTIYIPLMGDAAYGLQAALQAEGVDARLFPRSNEETLLLGRKHTCGKECYPCIITTGDMLRVTRAEGFDPGRTAFFMPSAMGPCRFGQYNQLQRLVLDDVGLADVPIISFNQAGRMSDEMKVFGAGVFLNAWRGILAIDLLGRKLRETRPWEKRPGESDAAYLAGRNRILASVRERRSPAHAIRSALEAFDRVPADNPGDRPIIGIVGEIFVRLNEFSNENLVRRVEELGGEAWLAPTSEWFFHVNRSLRLYHLLRGEYRAFLYALGTGLVQRRTADTLFSAADPFLRQERDADIRHCWAEAEPYVPGWFGETALSIGTAAHWVKAGVSGIVNVMPFTCLPGNIAVALFRKFQADHGGIPCLNMAYDGLEQSNKSLRLEAFIHQAAQYRATREAGRAPDAGRKAGAPGPREKADG